MQYEYIFNMFFNTLNAELNLICHLLALLGVHYFIHVSRMRGKKYQPDDNPTGSKHVAVWLFYEVVFDGCLIILFFLKSMTIAGHAFTYNVLQFAL
jgi:hypothetical protein